MAVETRQAETFDGAPASVSAARQFARTALDAAAVPEPPLEDAVLLTSEVASNAVQHARTPFEVVVRADTERVRIEVLDSDPTVPSPVRAGSHATSGRGLSIVQRIASDWGVEMIGPGKRVWFELRVL